jgi:UDP-sugar pyrophosphorylase
MPGEKMGVICRLVDEQDFSKEVVINVEYNQLDSMLKEKWNPEGDIKNEQGYSHFLGNTNNTLVFKILEYYDNLVKNGGAIPEFVNPKYGNAEKTLFKSVTRLECMMQDYPKLLSSIAIIAVGNELILHYIHQKRGIAALEIESTNLLTDFHTKPYLTT